MILLHLLIIFFLLPQAVSAETSLKKASFIPQWNPQAQFAGFYVAYEKGIYKKHGIDLRILLGGPDKPSLEFLEKGKATFATQWLSTAIQKRSQGIKLINIWQIIQRSALMLVAKKSRGIHKPQDMNGKKVSLWREEFQIQPKAFFKKYNIDVKVVPQSHSVNLFLREGVDVASAMWYNEYHTILNSGLDPDELSHFFFHDHGLNFPEDGIYALENTFKKDPELSLAFVKATIEGWLYAFSNPDKALDIIMIYMSAAKIPANRVHQKWMLERMKDLILPRGNFDSPLGILTPADFMLVSRKLQKSGLIKEIPDFNSFYIKCTQ